VIATKFGFDLSDPAFAGRDSRPAQRPYVVPIPGTRRAARVEENVGSRYAEGDVPTWD
jgi:hypothetical protein